MASKTFSSFISRISFRRFSSTKSAETLCSRVPVKDIIHRQTEVSKLQKLPIASVQQTQTISEAIRDMATRRNTVALVTDHASYAVGMVTQHDLIKGFIDAPDGNLKGSVRQVMTPLTHLYSVDATGSLRDCLNVLLRGFHHVAVIEGECASCMKMENFKFMFSAKDVARELLFLYNQAMNKEHGPEGLAVAKRWTAFDVSQIAPCAVTQSEEQRHYHAVADTATVADALREMADKQVGTLIVAEASPRYAHQDFVGVITQRACFEEVLFKGKPANSLKVKDVMKSRPLTVSPAYSFSQALSLLSLVDCAVPIMAPLGDPIDQDVRCVGLLQLHEVVKSVIHDHKAHSPHDLGQHEKTP